MVDAYGALGTELSERLLAEKVMLNPSTDPDLVKRILTHVAIKDQAPFEVSCMWCRMKLLGAILDTVYTRL